MWPDTPTPLIGMGGMRLSTERDRDDERSIAVLHAAFEAGVTLIDTADAYGWDEQDTGHNERLIARALSTWTGDRSRMVVATKGGLRRPQGAWSADGRARHLTAACEASRHALGCERIGLYQLHAPDPRTPLATSVRALASLQRDGAIEAIGLCNVNVGQIEEAMRIAEIAAVQVELSLWRQDNLLNGVVEYCIGHGIRVLAYRPLGGPQRARRLASDRALTEIAARHGGTPHQIALAWLAGLSPAIVPIPGVTRRETAALLWCVRDLELGDEDRARLDERCPAARRLRPSTHPRANQSAPPSSDGEVVLIMGLPGAGKTTASVRFVDQGYARLNRDEEGGSLGDLLTELDRLIASGHSRIVLDNTYVSRASRAPVVEAARARGLRTRCVWLSTSVEDAQVNAVARMISKYGRLLGPEEMARTVRRDVNAFGPSVQFRYQRALELPHPSEGFSQTDSAPFERARNPAFTARAIILWCDGVLRRSRSGQRSPVSIDDEEVLVERADTLRRYASEGWQLCALSWQPGIAEGAANTAEVEAGFVRMQERLGVAIDVLYCPHGAGPPVCWCRKPLPGLGVVLIERYRLDPAQCIYVGHGAQDPGFARRLGFQYREASDFFASTADAVAPT